MRVTIVATGAQGCRSCASLGHALFVSEVLSQIRLVKHNDPGGVQCTALFS